MTNDKIRISWEDMSLPQPQEASKAGIAGHTIPVARPSGSASAPFGRQLLSLPAHMFDRLRFYLGDGLLYVGLYFGLFLVSVLLLVISYRAQSQIRPIEAVLRQDSQSTVGVKSVAEVIDRMRSINLASCPNDFRSAYVSHIHAWEAFSEAVQERNNMSSWSQIASDSIETLIRIYLVGDVFGKALESNATLTQIERKLQLAGQHVRESYQRVEAIAVNHGATLPTKSRAGDQ